MTTIPRALEIARLVAGAEHGQYGYCDDGAHDDVKELAEFVLERYAAAAIQERPHPAMRALAQACLGGAGPAVGLAHDVLQLLDELDRMRAEADDHTPDDEADLKTEAAMQLEDSP